MKEITREEFEAQKKKMTDKLPPVPKVKPGLYTNHPEDGRLLPMTPRPGETYGETEDRAHREAGYTKKESGFLPNPLQEAIDQKFFVDPTKWATNIAKGWSVILGKEISPEQVPLCMIWANIYRETWRPDHQNEVEIAKHVKLLHEIKATKERTAIDTGK